MSRTIANGTKVRTNDVLGSERGMMVSFEHKVERVPSADGVIAGLVPNHGGGLYWVQHEGASDVAPYRESEFEVMP